MTIHVRTDPACAAYAGSTPLAARGVTCPACAPAPVHYSQHAGWCPVSRVFDADPVLDCACGPGDDLDAASAVAVAIIDEAHDYTDEEWSAILAASAEAVANAGARYFVATSTPVSRGPMVRQPRELPFSTPAPDRSDPDDPETHITGRVR